MKGILVHTASAAARSFYLHMGFDPSPIDPDTMLLRLSELRRFGTMPLQQFQQFQQLEHHWTNRNSCWLVCDKPNAAMGFIGIVASHTPFILLNTPCVVNVPSHGNLKE